MLHEVSISLGEVKATFEFIILLLSFFACPRWILQQHRNVLGRDL